MKKQKGHTLIEMLFVVTLVGIGMVLFSAVFFSGWINYEVNLTRLNLQAQLDSALTMLEEDVLEAEDFPTISGTTSILLKYPNSPNFLVQQRTYQIDVDGSLIRISGASSEVLINQLLDTGKSQFYQDSQVNNVLVCDLTLQERTFGHLVVANGQKKIAVRN
ncbi:MAG: type II secretion system protein [Candidatus Aceula meridiana]|nr:type II secretion system protein [Candidatus Aceula meridiana]